MQLAWAYRLAADLEFGSSHSRVGLETCEILAFPSSRFKFVLADLGEPAHSLTAFGLHMLAPHFCLAQATVFMLDLTAEGACRHLS